MQSCPLDQLPFELFRRIIRYVPVDAHYETLCALSLASKSMRDLAQPALFETVVLKTTEATESFSELLKSDSGFFFASLVRNLSPWNDDGEEERRRSAAVIEMCPNLLNLQSRGTVLVLVPPSARSYEEAFLWLEIPALATEMFARTSRLHIADLQLLISRSPDEVISTFTAENFPRLQYFSSTWAAYQMFDDADHAALHNLACAVLALPHVTRCVVRVDGMAGKLPTLAAIDDVRLLIAVYDERDEVRSSNLDIWKYNALRAQSMWVSHLVPRAREPVDIVGAQALDESHSWPSAGDGLLLTREVG